jgi:hypothetical protein
MEYDITADARLVHIPDRFCFRVGDRVKRRRLDGTIDTFIVVPSSGECSDCDFSYQGTDPYAWDVCLPNPGYSEKMCYRHARGEPRIMFKSIDKVLEEI